MTNIPLGAYKRFKPLVAALQRLMDPLIVMLCLGCAERIHHVANRGGYALLMLLSAMLTAMVFGGFGLYRSWRTGNTLALVQRLILAWLTVFVFLLVIGYAFKGTAQFSRVVIFLWALLTPMVLCMAHAQIRWYLAWLRRSGRNLRSVVFVGANDLAARMAEMIEREDSLGLIAHGVFSDVAPDPCYSLRWLGAIAVAPTYVRERDIELIYITLSPQSSGPLPALLKELQALPASVYFVPDLLVFGLLEARLDDFNGLPVLAIGETRVVEAAGLIKELIDLALAAAILLATAPLLALFAALVKLSSPGPVFFRQRRYGLSGEPITVFKFRTMRVCEDGDEIHQAKAQDPRITRIGALLRRSSLDELPQFLNVLLGQMSIVGPRPHAIAHNELYRHLIPGYMLRHRVKPGITGWAQIHGLRGETETVEKMQRRVEYDLYYIRHWSVLMDLQIIARTPWALLRRSNAY